MNNLTLNANSSEDVSKIVNWCMRNLKNEDWTQDVIGIFPLQVKFHFHCPKQHLLAILST